MGENNEKYITFTAPLEKEVMRIDKNGKEITKNISYILQFIDSARFIENEKKKQILMNKPIYLGLSILELSKILMYEFWYFHVKPKYGEKAKLCYMI